MNSSTPSNSCPLDVIVLDEKWTECHRCGAETLHCWGLPVDEFGDYVPNDYQGEWGGVTGCERCWREHEDWSNGKRDSFTKETSDA